ncbi:hypothetical protein KBZ21_39100, partial [Streptomyces sp. A73]|nr:hypothetical protein [Streptomyces sp. A73]
GGAVTLGIVILIFNLLSLALGLAAVVYAVRSWRNSDTAEGNADAAVWNAAGALANAQLAALKAERIRRNR